MPQTTEAFSAGAHVSAPATYFDSQKGPRWSEAVYGAEWGTARVFGSVLRVDGGQVVVRFEDGDIVRMSPRNLAMEPEIAGSSRPQKTTEASDSSGKLNKEGTGAFLLLSCYRKICERVVVFDVLVYV